MRYVGPVAVWFIPKPTGPRVSVRACAIAWMIALPILAGTLLWFYALSRTFWPFGRAVSNLPELLLRYEITIVVCLAYMTSRSLPIWLRYRALAKQDVRALDVATQTDQVEQAALYLHRYCLLMSALWRRLPARVAAWDAVLRKRLPRHRRVYIHYPHNEPPPELPPNSGAGFAPAVIPQAGPSAWWILGLVPIAFLLYLLIAQIMIHEQWQSLLLTNVLLLAFVLFFYGGYFLLSILGRSYHFRFAPGVVQMVKSALGQRRPSIETFDLRRMHTVLDLSSRVPGLILIDFERGQREAFRLPHGPETVEAVLRAALSTAPRPPL